MGLRSMGNPLPLRGTRNSDHDVRPLSSIIKAYREVRDVMVPEGRISVYGGNQRCWRIKSRQETPLVPLKMKFTLILRQCLPRILGFQNGDRTAKATRFNIGDRDPADSKALVPCLKALPEMGTERTVRIKKYQQPGSAARACLYTP